MLASVDANEQRLWLIGHGNTANTVWRNDIFDNDKYFIIVEHKLFNVIFAAKYMSNELFGLDIPFADPAIAAGRV